MAVTYAPHALLADAVRALAERVGTLAGGAPDAQPFAAAVHAVVTWVTERPDAIAGDVAIVFDRDDDRLVADIGWSASGAPELPGVDAASTPGVDVVCDIVAGTGVHCRVSCRCA